MGGGSRFATVAALWAALAATPARAAEPACLERAAGERPEKAVRAAGLDERALLARLVFAEGVSTNADTACPERAAAVFEAIAWGVMNRVRLGAARPALRRKYGAGVDGVVFAPGQFNPAVSPRSRFSELFLCPSRLGEGWRAVWARAEAAADAALGDPARNPFLLTAWERRHGLSLVAHFYYPRSVQATPVPPSWADASPGSPTLVRDAVVGGAALGTDCVWFFRLERPFER